MKPTWPAETSLSIPMGIHRDGNSAGGAVVYTMKQECFSFADMLPVKVFMFILNSRDVKLAALGAFRCAPRDDSKILCKLRQYCNVSFSNKRLNP